MIITQYLIFGRFEFVTLAAGIGDFGMFKKRVSMQNKPLFDSIQSAPIEPAKP